MIIKDKTIDGGKGFDWGRVSSEYAKYRDIYPKIFFRKILDLGLCKDGQKILDLGTGTGVYQEICIAMVGFGPEQIFRKNKLNRRNICLLA